MAKLANRIFSVDNPKAIKAQQYGYLNAIHYMAPSSQAGVGNLCPDASPGCIELCLGWTSGQAGMVKHDTDINSVRKSRIDKARHFMRDRKGYMAGVEWSIQAAKRKAKAKDMTLCVRMNGATDIAWEGVAKAIFSDNADVQFVDYTKSKKRALAHARGQLPSNYHLTFSRSETNEIDCIDVLNAGGNVAVIFANGLPETYLGHLVIDGDEHDLRHLDKQGGYIVGLSPKGNKAKKSTSGFIVRN